MTSRTAVFPLSKFQRRNLMRSRNTLCLLLPMVIVLAGSPAFSQDGDEDILRGRYGLSVSQSCMETPRGRPPATGFDPNTRALLQPAEVVNAVLKGVITFDREFHVTVGDALLSDLFLDKKNIGDVPISSNTPLACTGGYSRKGESLSFTLDCLAQLPNNLRVAIGTFQLEGFIGLGDRSITISSINGNILKESVSIGGVTVAQRERVCLMQGGLNKLRNKR